MIEDRYQHLKPGFKPHLKEFPTVRMKYRIKNGYYLLSGLVFLSVALSLYIVWDLKQTGAFFQSYSIDRNIIIAYIIGMSLVTMGLRLRAGFCAVCGQFRRPMRFDFNQYCDHCGAHLFKFKVFAAQEEGKSPHDIPLHERLMAMVKRDDDDAIRMLLYKGAEVNEPDRFGNTA